MRIRLVDTPLAIPRYRQVRLPTVAAELSQYADVEINDENVEPVDYSPVDLVGITAQAYNAPRAFYLAQRFKELGIRTVLGGPLAAGLGAAGLHYFDAVVVGEVEGLGEKLIRDLARGTLRGVYQLDRPPEDWGRPAPRRDLQDADRYYWFNYPIEFTRGCPHRCSFCFGSVAYPTFRTRSLESIAKDLAQWDHGMIEAVDLHFAADRSHLIGVCNLLADMKVAGWFGEATLHSLDDEEVLRHLERSNCKMVFVGIESIEEEALKAANKAFNQVEKYRDAIRRIQDHGIYVHGGFIFGLDAQSRNSFESTFRFCEENKIYLASTNIATYYPGTAVFEELEKQDRIITTEERKFDGAHVVARSSSLDPKDSLDPKEVYAGTKRFLNKFYSLSSIAKRSIQSPNFRLSTMVDYVSFNLVYRAYYRRWARRLGSERIPWEGNEDERQSFPYVGGRMPFIYGLLDRSWRFFHRWYEAWDRPPLPASLLFTTLLALVVGVVSFATLHWLDAEAAVHWPLPWPPVLPVLGCFGAATLASTWVVTRLARYKANLPEGRPPGSDHSRWLRRVPVVVLILAVVSMGSCCLVLPLPHRGWSFAMSTVTVLFLMKSYSVLASSRISSMNPRRVAAFVLLYPTLDFDDAFRFYSGPKRPLVRHVPLYIKGLMKIAAGTLLYPALFYVLLRDEGNWLLTAAGYIGRLCVLYLFLAGTLEWLTGYWRMVGYAVPRPFGHGWWSPVSPARLWRKWNSVMHRWLHRYVYMRVGGGRAIVSTMSAFLVSGVLVAAALYPVNNKMNIDVMLFFLANGSVVALEKCILSGRCNSLAFRLTVVALGVVVFLCSASWLFSVTDMIVM